ncbi:MAG: DUF6036 family nucleotidyltransferase [Gemmatimonadota bacterium]|nr:DUF6036 family nucleotidyltransferase [Gemmatimonadota bacterium]
MRREVTRETLRELMKELARTAPSGESFRVYLVGGGTAVLAGWRASTIDADLYAERDEVFGHIQAIKERLRLNVEFARPEHFVPALEGSPERHVFIDRVGRIEFFHYDPYAQLFSKIVRGFRKDLDDAEQFVKSGMVEPHRFRELFETIPVAAWARHPNLSRPGVSAQVESFLATLE